MEISTSVLNVKEENAIETFYRLEVAHTDYYHIDVMDGKFVDNNTEDLMREYADNLKNITNIPLDVHLMVENVKEFVDIFAPTSPKNITFHIEKNNKSEIRDKEEVLNLIKYIKDQNTMVSIAVNPETDIKEVYEYLPLVHNVLIMSVHPGKGGQKFIEDTIEKIKQLSKYINDNNLENEIEVDGGINNENIEKIKESGANIAVVGSYVINSKDYKYTINKLKYGE